MLSALGEVIERAPNLGLIATAKTSLALLELSERIHADVAIIDWVLPPDGAERSLERLRDQEKPPRCIVYAADDGLSIAKRAMAAGAAGFCSRDKPTDHLINAIEKVHQGEMVFPFFDIRSLRQDPIETLTKREHRLLTQLATTGQSNKELAQDLGVSVNTIKFHLRNLFEKLQIRTRAQAIALYYAKGRNHEPLN